MSNLSELFLLDALKIITNPSQSVKIILGAKKSSQPVLMSLSVKLTIE